MTSGLIALSEFSPHLYRTFKVILSLNGSSFDSNTERRPKKSTFFLRDAEEEQEGKCELAAV